MPLRKAGAYTSRYTRPYTRKSAVRSKSYVKTMPAAKVVKFNMGDQQGFNAGKYKFQLRLKSDVVAQIRDNSLEASRQHVNKQLDEIMPGAYFFELKAHPHHILRENRVITGAGADRMQTGMQLSFGSPLGRAALVKKGQDIFFLAVGNEKNFRLGRRILHSLRSKLPCSLRVGGEIIK